MRFLLAATWVTDLKSNVSEAVNAYWQDLWQIFGEGEGPPPTNGRLCGPDTGALSLTTLSGCPLSDEPVIGALSC